MLTIVFKQSVIVCLVWGTLQMGWSQKLYVEANGAKNIYKISAIDSLIFSSKDDSLILAGDSVLQNWPLTAIKNIQFGNDSIDTYKSVVVELASKSISYNLENVVGIAFESDIIDSGDWDGDKLLNDEEIKIYGTDPRVADTDGDGYDDYEEVYKGSGRVWHPLIADLPGIALEIKGYPNIDFIVTEGATRSRTKEVEKGEAIENSETKNESHNTSFITEQGWSHSIEAGYDDGFVAKYTGEFHGSTSEGTETEYGTSRTSGYTQSINQAWSEMLDSSLTFTGGVITIPFAIKNTGSIAYTVENLIISCYTIDFSKSTSFFGAGCELNPDTRFCTFQPFTLGPGECKVPQWFAKNDLTLDQTKELTSQGNALMCEIKGSYLTHIDKQGNTSDFTNAMTNVPARTADILVDFGPGKGKQPLRNRVAVLYKFNPQHTGLNDIYHAATLHDILQTLDLKYEMGTSNGKAGIVSLDGVANDPDINGCWFIALERSNSNSYIFYSHKQDGYRPDAIQIGVNDRVEIIYSIDQDKDGIPLRTENILGTDDTRKDTDGDSLTDFEEIMGWVSNGDTLTSDPIKMDTDGDGISDPYDPNPLQRKLGSNAAITKINIMGSDGCTFEIDNPERGLAGSAIITSSKFTITIKTEDYLTCTVKGSDLRTDTLKLIGNTWPPVYSVNLIPELPCDSLVIKTVAEDGSDSAFYIVNNNAETEKWVPLLNENFNGYTLNETPLKSPFMVFWSGVQSENVITNEKSASSPLCWKSTGRGSWVRADGYSITRKSKLKYQAKFMLTQAEKGAVIGFAYKLVDKSNESRGFAEAILKEASYVGTWHEVIGEVDCNLNKVIIKVDGFAVSEYSYETEEHEKAFTHFTFGTLWDGSSATITAYFDDIKLWYQE